LNDWHGRDARVTKYVMQSGRTKPPLIIAHRGASGYRPEHTMAAFELAVEMGADAIETDLVPTRDGVLICRHDAELSLTTDVADHPEFADRHTYRDVDGMQLEGWFVENFTWDELRTLRAHERWPFRDHSFDGKFEIVSLSELLAFQQRARTPDGRQIQLFLELKHPAYFATRRIDIPRLLLDAVFEHRFSPIHIESFEEAVLLSLRSNNLSLIQLIDDPATRPFDFTLRADPRTFGDLITPYGLSRIAEYASGIGAWKRLIVPAQTPDADAVAANPVRLAAPTSLLADAHAAGLQVHAWTFRSEPAFLAEDYAGDFRREYQQFREVGVDGFISDYPDHAQTIP
jgi:glycerophosphoryl diester phosphodiesterase